VDKIGYEKHVRYGRYTMN